MPDTASTISEVTVATVTSPPKPGWQTSEFWLKIGALLLTALYASGVIPTSGTAATIAAISATLLAALGYTVSRTLVKLAGVLLLVLALGGPQVACGGSTGDIVSTGGSALLTCGKQDKAALLHASMALLAAAAYYGVDIRTIGTPTFAQAGAEFLTAFEVIGVCVYAEVRDSLAHPKAPSSTTPTDAEAVVTARTAPPVPDPLFEAAKRKWKVSAVQLANGAVY